MWSLQYCEGEHHQHHRQSPTAADHGSVEEVTDQEHYLPSCEVGYHGFDVMANAHHWLVGGEGVIVRINTGIGTHPLQCGECSDHAISSPMKFAATCMYFYRMVYVRLVSTHTFRTY